MNGHTKSVILAVVAAVLGTALILAGYLHGGRGAGDVESVGGFMLVAALLLGMG